MTRSRAVALLVMIIGISLMIAAIFFFQRARQTTQALDIPYPGVNRVGVDEAKAAYDKQSAIFLDVRDAESFTASHIPGSLNIPTNQLKDRLQEVPSGQWIITYCT